MPEARHQNEVVIRAFTACTEHYANGGYHVFVDGVIGPWHFDPWLELAGKGLSVDYVILRPDQQTTVDRAAARAAGGALVDRDVVAAMWAQFAGLNDYESNVVDTTGQSVDRSLEAVRAAIADGRTRIAKRRTVEST